MEKRLGMVKKKSVFKNLCHQIAMIKTAGVQLNMWGVLGGYIQYPGLYLWIVVSYYKGSL